MYQAAVIKTQNKFFLPFGDARFAPIATEDIGRVAAAILADPATHAGRSYDLFSPVILDMKEVAEISSDPYLLQHLAWLGEDLKKGRPAGMNDLVETAHRSKTDANVRVRQRQQIGI
jgi:uncharacterized protein YbjT (DUF2867 family)